MDNDGQRERTAGFTGANPMKELGQQIVILDGGFVYVATCALAEGFLLMSNARCIRKWGTTQGLGQLRSGPTKTTVLDAAGEVVAPIGRVIHMIRCTATW